MPLPMPPMISGSRFAPKIRITIARMTKSSGRPIRPIIALLAPANGRRYRGKTGSLYHQLHGASGEFPLSGPQKPAPQALVRLRAGHKLREDLTDWNALTTRGAQQRGHTRREEHAAQV